MSVYRVNPENVRTNRLRFSAEEARHMRAMRQKKGDVIRVSDGDITEYEVELTELTRRGAAGKIRTRQVTRRDRLFVWLGQAVPKGWKLDWIVEKAVELGAGAVSPILADRSVPRLDADRAADRHQRWQRVAEAARKQCGRIRPMEVGPPISLDDFLRETKNAELKIVFHEKSPMGLRETLSKASSKESVAVLIGPEGGFTESEVRSAEAAGFLPTHMGPRILRSETAPIAVLAILEYIFGEMGEGSGPVGEINSPSDGRKDPERP